MTRWVGVFGLLVLLLISSVFAALNGDRRVSIDFGVGMMHRVPVTFVVFGSVLMGMLVMLAVGVRSDLKVRRILKERLGSEVQQDDDAHDRLQQDLFGESSEESPP